MISSEPSLPPIPADFPDWLGPMAVKELRQGLRSRIFLGIFFLLQLALFCWMVLTLADEVNMEAADGLFWTLVGCSMGLVSLRGLSAIYQERKKDTLELLQLCVPSLWGILLGKWSSLLFQLLVIAASLLPYLLIRYFFGHFDLLLNLHIFLLLVCCASFLSSLALLASMLRRIGIIICTILLIFILPQLLSFLIFSLFAVFGAVGFSITEHPGLVFLVCDFLLLNYALLLLALGSSFSASPFDNAAVRLKTLGWLLLLPAFLLGTAGAPFGLTLLGVLLAAPGVFLVFFFSATLRSLRDPARAEEMFADWGRWRRWSARLLAPTVPATNRNNLFFLACAPWPRCRSGWSGCPGRRFPPPSFSSAGPAFPSRFPWR